MGKTDILFDKGYKEVKPDLYKKTEVYLNLEIDHYIDLRDDDVKAYSYKENEVVSKTDEQKRIVATLKTKNDKKQERLF